MNDLLQYLPLGSTANQSSSDSDLAQLIGNTGAIDEMLGGEKSGAAIPAGYSLGTDASGFPTLVKNT